MSSAKRKDLQGIRGFAILAVLLFHFFPKQFPNGYIGVDQFFVLSGFLIAMVLSKEDAINTESIKSFYYRRVKRIIPLYIFVIIFILLSLLFLFPDTIFEKNSDSAWAALLFATNLRGDDPEKQYLALLTLAEDAFAHTWSLAVEMQFYLLVPIFFFVLRRIPIQFRSYFIAAVVSCSGYYHATADEYTSFNSVFARLWQFFSGIFAFLTSENVNKLAKNTKMDLEQNASSSEKRTKNSKMLSNLLGACCLTTLLMTFFPVRITDLLLRVLITLQTVAMMMAGSSVQNILVSNKPICYLGDISYAVYLVHWPIYSYCKQHSQDYTFNVLYTGLVFSIVLGVILTETYEKFYLTLSQRQIFILLLGLYLCCLSLLLPDTLNSTDDLMADLRNGEGNWTKEKVLELNNKIAGKEKFTVYISNCKDKNNKPVSMNHWCEFEGLENGTKKIMIIGNSWAANNAPTIYDKCQNKAARMTMFSPGACEGLVVTKSCCKANSCGVQYKKLLEYVKEDKPDILFMMFRHVDLFVPRLKNSTKDVMVENGIARLKEYENLVKEKIFILDAMPRNNDQILTKLNKAVKAGKLIPQADVDSGEDWRLARSRIQKITKTCRKCELIDFMPSFMKRGKFLFFNDLNGLAYFSQGVHLTPHGKKLTEPIIEKVCGGL